MELTQELIDSLAVDEGAILGRIAAELNVRVMQALAVVNLVKEGCTIPFISRYRKEMHGSLDEVQVRDCDRLFTSYTNLETRRLEIVRGIFTAGKLTESLYEGVMKARTLTELEDLWLPFKKKKKTRGMLAIEKGLEPLADAMCELNTEALEAKAADFVRDDPEMPELSVKSVKEALDGARDIIAERVSQNSENRSDVHSFYYKTGKIRVKGIGDEETAKKSVYQMYWDYEEPLNQIKSHRVLAINRGEREGVLEITIEVDVEGAIDLLKGKYVTHNPYHGEAIEDGLVRLLSPAVVREIRSEQTDDADERGILMFSENLRNLLMTRPIKGTRVLALDPGIRTGTKCVALDETGKYLGYFVVNQQTAPDAALAAIRIAVQKYGIQCVAVGNGTGSHDVQTIVSRVLSENYPDVQFTVVDEDGASVYSASDTAREEFPELDLTIRGAISIGRRLQDPLAELVKIDPKSIGVGLYQHDVNQKRLGDTLDEVVGSVVNNVGVNLNTASASLLKYVSGINSGLAKKIVSYRDEHGAITSREDLKKVGGMGEKTFEQCAGFLKIPESADPLDKTWVHPENYALAREVLPLVQAKTDVTGGTRKTLRDKYQVGDTTIDDIIGELKKPSRDPREGYPAPIMQQGVLTFEDLKEGMKVTGKIKNVVDFGAFVDLGIKETALLHISEMADFFIKSPLDAVKVGDVKECTVIALDSDRRRISLSLKSDAAPRAGAADKERAAGPRVVVKKAAVPGGTSVGAAARADPHSAVKSASPPLAVSRGVPRSEGSDDGTRYNPFAVLLRKQG